MSFRKVTFENLEFKTDPNNDDLLEFRMPKGWLQKLQEKTRQFAVIDENDNYQTVSVDLVFNIGEKRY